MFNAINITPEHGNSETLVSFAKPKTEQQALQRAKRTIKEDLGKVVSLVRNPPAHGQYVWTAYSKRKVAAWVTLTPTE